MTTFRRLVLYSDQRAGISSAVDDALMALLEGTAHRVTFLPSTSDRHRRYFVDAEAHYASLGVHDVAYCPLAEGWDEGAMHAALAGDAIHLGSGDPSTLAASLSRRGLLPKLRAFVERGGVLVGVSAGAMVLGKTLALAEHLQAFEQGARSRATKPKTAAKGLGLVDFDFAPHFGEDVALSREVQAYSRTSARVVYACSDADGIVCDERGARMLGSPTRFERGVDVTASHRAPKPGQLLP